MCNDQRTPICRRGAPLAAAVPVLAAALLTIAVYAWPRGTLAQVKPLKEGTKDHKLYQDLLKATRSSDKLKGGWMVETPTHLVHSTISKEYTAAAAVHLNRFHRRFTSIFKQEFIIKDKAVAYAFATEAEYLKFSPGLKGTWGRFATRHEQGKTVKDLAWYSLPEGEKNFYKTDIEVVQHEATHQLLDAYTDNLAIPDWFDEGLASFFESWDLDQDNAKNILSGVDGSRGLGIRLSYPHQKPEPLFTRYWIPLRELLGAEHFVVFDEGPREWPPKPDAARDEQKFMVKETQYNEGWCVVAFLIDHEVGRDYFVKLVEAFRNRDHLSQIQARLFTEEFLTGFERAWHRFIEKKVLKKLEMETVGGKKLRPGDTSPPPRGTEGWPLTGDSRGDLFLVAAEAGVAPKAFAGEKWWMLKAWGMPARFYAEAWRRAPHVAAGKRVRLVGGLYRLQAIEGLGGPGSRAFVLFPAWLPSTASDEIAARLPGAAAKLIETAKGKAGEGKKPPAPPAGERGAAATD